MNCCHKRATQSGSTKRRPLQTVLTAASRQLCLRAREAGDKTLGDCSCVGGSMISD